MKLGAHKTGLARILEYARAASWTIVSCGKAYAPSKRAVSCTGKPITPL